MTTQITRPSGPAASPAARTESAVERRHRRSNRYKSALFTIVLGIVSTLLFPPTTLAGAPAPLHVEGRHFVDDSGRVVILRGVNLTGDAKVPPFRPKVGPRDLDRIASLGMNVIRLVFIWEAYEPYPGQHDDSYLACLRRIAEEAAARGIYTIIDIHQDGFSRHASRGAGVGFPCWAVSRRGTPSVPDDSPACSKWPVLMVSDPTTHRSFDDFFADAGDVRTRFLAMVGRVATAFAGVPGVIGYDLLNEPWGDEATDLAPLYDRMAAAIREAHPSAILFVEGHITTNCGMATKLPRPGYGGFAYAPHYYKPLTMLLKGWRSGCAPIDHAFDQMTGQAARWDCPLFLGEFGVAAGAANAGLYISALYDRLDASLASGAQWNMTPGWTPARKDGWNGEDLSIVDGSGRLRANFRPRPYPRITAGMPTHFEYREGNAPTDGRSIAFTWVNNPALGETEIALPDGLFRPGTPVQTSSPDVVATHDPARRTLVCRSSSPGPITIRMAEPTILAGAGSTGQARRGLFR